MAGLDPSIILGAGQGVTPLQNPMDVMGKAMNYQNLAMSNAVQRQQFSDEQAMRNAYSQNTSVDANGNPSVDRAGILKSLASTSPSLVSKASMGFQQMDIANLQAAQQKTEMAAQTLNGVHDEASYQAAKNSPFAQSNGSQNWPPNYDENFVSHYLAKSLNTKDYLTTQIAQQNANTEAAKAGIETKKLGLSLQENQNKNMQDTMTALESMRGSKAAQTAESNLFSAQKINSLATLYSDPNKLSQAQVNLLHQELGNMASNGAPTMETLKGLAPNTFTGMASAQYSRFMNEPTAANAAAFVNQAKQYSDAISKDAKGFLGSRYGSIIEMKKGSLTPQQYQTVNQQVLDKLNGRVEPGTPFSQFGNQNSQTNSPPEGSTKQWGGKNWVVQGNHWVVQSTSSQANK